jgi:hypothetical protein
MDTLEGALELILDPPRSVGPIIIGMPFDEAESALRDIPGIVSSPTGEKHAPGFAHYESEMSIAVDSGPDGRVRSIEIYRPTRGVEVRFRDISIFEVPADEVIVRLGQVATVEVQDDGLRVIAPDLLISLWRSVLPEGPWDEDGRYFESILVAAPGYYDFDR